MRKELLCATVVVGLTSVAGCTAQKYRWAFSQNIDGTVRGGETCRETLADSIYAPANAGKLIQAGAPNVFTFQGAVETYRLLAFKTQAECEAVLASVVSAQGIR